jgi:hypothetical protein
MESRSDNVSGARMSSSTDGKALSEGPSVDFRFAGRMKRKHMLLASIRANSLTQRPTFQSI